MNKLGGDILRLWVASADYSGEMTVSDEILKRSADAYRRIRNTSRFLLANLSGYDPKQHQVPMDEMVELDRWIVGRAADLQKQLVDAYDNYQFLSVVQKLMHFCSIELGSFYLDIIKDRQYTAKADIGAPFVSDRIASYCRSTGTLDGADLWLYRARNLGSVAG